MRSHKGELRRSFVLRGVRQQGSQRAVGERVLPNDRVRAQGRGYWRFQMLHGGVMLSNKVLQRSIILPRCARADARR